MLRLSTRIGAPRVRLLLPWFFSILFMLGCGGGGSNGPAYSVEVSPASLVFNLEQGAPLPQPKILNVSYKGDGLVVGYPTGVAVPSWLGVAFTSSSASSASLSVRITDAALPPGTYTTTLRVVTGKADGSQFVYKDIPVSCEVKEGLHAVTRVLSFTTMEGQAPAPQTLSLASGLTPFGWALSVEPVNGGATDWLVLPVSSGTSATTTADVQIQASARPQGAYAAVLVLKDATGFERDRIQVSYVVSGVYALTGTSSASLSEAAALADLDLPLLLQTRLDAATGASRPWSISCDQPWVTVSPSTGNLSTSTALVARLDPSKLWSLANGTHTAMLRVTFPGTATSPTTLPLTLTLALHPALIAEATARFTVTGATPVGQLAKTITLRDNLGTAFAGHSAWHSSCQESWLSATSSGDAGTPGTLALTLEPTGLAPLDSGQYSTSVTIQPDDPRVAAATCQVALDLTLPSVAHVAPYCTWVNRSEPLILRGSGFSGSSTLPVAFGTEVVQGTVISDTEIHVTSPAQGSAGRVAVSVENGLGLARAHSELVVLPEPMYGAAEVVVPGYAQSMVLDPERQAVLLVGGQFNNVVSRLRWRQGSWGLDSFPLPNASGVAVTLDGKDLLMSAGGVNIPDLFLRIDPETLQMRQSTGFTNQYADFYSNYNLFAGFNDGRVLVIDSDQWAETVWYPSLTQGPYLMTHGTVILVTRDRSRLVAHTTTSSSPETYSMDVADGAFVQRPISASFNGRAWGTSQDGGRFVAATTVYDRQFTFIGSLVLPEPAVDSVAVSPDGTKAYTLTWDSANSSWRLRRTDITAPMGPYHTDVQPLAFNLPASHVPIAMRVSEDGGTLFVLSFPYGSGVAESHLFSVPLP